MFDWLFKPKCKHIWKTEEETYLYSKDCMWNAGASVEIDYYDYYAHRQKCMVCDMTRIIKRGELVPYPKTRAI